MKDKTYSKIVMLLILMLFAVLASVLIISIKEAKSQQTKLPSYEHVRRGIFYQKLYRLGGFTLYCGEWFSDRRGLNIEHVYPASWMKNIAGCFKDSRLQCRKKSKMFNLMEADLHNLWPAIAFVNQDRKNYKWSNLLRNSNYEACNFKINKRAKLAEPRKQAKGNVARSVLYMHTTYRLPLSRKDLILMIQWNRLDPVSSNEMKRNNKIEKLQGTRNKFIDNPRLAESLLRNR